MDNEMKPTYVKVCYLEGEQAFIFEIYGWMVGWAFDAVEAELNNEEAEHLHGSGDYLFEVCYSGPQLDEYGRIEVPEEWDLVEISFEAFEL